MESLMASACLATRQAISDQRRTLIFIGPGYSSKNVTLILLRRVDLVRHRPMEACHKLEKRAGEVKIYHHIEASICQPTSYCYN